MAKYKINNDKEIVKLIREGLKRNNNFCPCEIEKTEDTKCMCKIMREQNICKCGLFINSD